MARCRGSLCSACCSSSSRTVLFSHTTPASASSSSQPNSIFLSHHSSSSLQLQPAERSGCVHMLHALFQAIWQKTSKDNGYIYLLKIKALFFSYLCTVIHRLEYNFASTYSLSLMLDARCSYRSSRVHMLMPTCTVANNTGLLVAKPWTEIPS